MVFVERTRCEEERVGASATGVIPKAQTPKAFELDGTFVETFEQAVEFAIEPERHDGAGSEVAHQQVAAVSSKG